MQYSYYIDPYDNNSPQVDLRELEGEVSYMYGTNRLGMSDKSYLIPDISLNKKISASNMANKDTNYAESQGKLASTPLTEQVVNAVSGMEKAEPADEDGEGGNLKSRYLKNYMKKENLPKTGTGKNKSKKGGKSKKDKKKKEPTKKEKRTTTYRNIYL